VSDIDGVTVDATDWDRPAPQSDPYRWETVGLGGARWLLRFETRPKIVAAVMQLMSCHDHHFAVVGEGYELALSRLAVRCLEERGLVDFHQRLFEMGTE
jgi:hypothetical protein